MSTTDVVVLTSAGLLCVAVAIVAVFALIELRRPPIRRRLDAIIEAAAERKKGPCP